MLLDLPQTKAKISWYSRQEWSFPFRRVLAPSIISLLLKNSESERFMNLRDEKVMLMQSHKDCPARAGRHRAAIPRWPHKAPINVLSRAQVELRPLSQRIVSVGPAWLSQEGSVALLTCQYAHVKICDKQDYTVQSELNEWYQWQWAKKIKNFFALVSCFQLADFIMCLSSPLKASLTIEQSPQQRISSALHIKPEKNCLWHF